MLARDIENWYYKAKPMPTADQTSHWLSWLAQQLQQESKDEFLIEGLQPTNLKNRTQQKIYNWIVGLIVGLINGLITGLIVGLITGLIVGLITGLIVGLIENRIKPVETFEFSLVPSKIRKFFQVLIYNWIYLLISVLISVLIYNWNWMSGLPIGCLNALLINGLKSDFVLRKHPNQGIFASLQNAIAILNELWKKAILKNLLKAKDLKMSD